MPLDRKENFAKPTRPLSTKLMRLHMENTFGARPFAYRLSLTIDFLRDFDGIALRRLDYARLFEERGDQEAAIELLASITKDWPEWPVGWFELGKLTKSADDFTRYLELDPEDHMGAALHLAKLGEIATPPQPPEAFVERLFDDYAADFENALLDRLEYQAPKILARLLPQERYQKVLDLGAGTGLMGEAISKRAGQIWGVDLSSEMLKIAEAKNLYSSLEVSEIHEWLGKTRLKFDLILAADVFSYIGELQTLFELCANALNKGGYLAFSVEASNQERDWHLRDTFRYAHNDRYLQSALAQAGFQTLSLARKFMRMDAGAPIDGHFVLAKRI